MRYRLGFNPRARVGRDQVRLCRSLHYRLFQSTRPRGARLKAEEERLAEKRFQSTRPRGARPGHGETVACVCKFQSTRPRGARRIASTKTITACNVSIHAPAWGATADAGNR